MTGHRCKTSKKQPEKAKGYIPVTTFMEASSSFSHHDLNLTYAQMKVVARHFQGKKQKDIAKDLGMAQPTVSAHLEAARRRNPGLFEKMAAAEGNDHRRRVRVRSFSQLEPTRFKAVADKLGIH